MGMFPSFHINAPKFSINVPKFNLPSTGILDEANQFGINSVKQSKKMTNDAGDNVSGAQAAKDKARQKAKDAERSAAAADATNTANAEDSANTQRLSLLRRQGYGSTVLAPSSLLGANSILG